MSDPFSAIGTVQDTPSGYGGTVALLVIGRVDPMPTPQMLKKVVGTVTKKFN
jgi:hypothetical protein